MLEGPEITWWGLQSSENLDAKGKSYQVGVS